MWRSERGRACAAGPQVPCLQLCDNGSPPCDAAPISLYSRRKSPLLLKMLSSVRASNSNLARPSQTLEIAGCVSAAVVSVRIVTCFKRASLTYRLAYLRF